LNPGFGQINHPVSTENAEAQKFFNQGLALIYRFNHNEARRAAKLDPNLAMAYWGKDTPGETPFGLNSAASVFKIAGHSLDARIAEAKNDRQSSIEHWLKAVEAQDALNYDEPPGWYYPVRESLGAALLLTGNAVEAEKNFRKDLDSNPRNGRSLFGLSESLKKQGKSKEALPIQKEFEAVWKNADTKLKIEDM